MRVASSLSSARGFTLVELLVTMALLGLISVLLFGGLRYTALTAGHGTVVLDRASDVALAVNFLRSTLADAQPLPASGDGAETGAIIFAGRPDRIVLIGVAPPHLARGGLYLIEIALDRETHILTARWAPLSPGDMTEKAAALPVSALLDHVARVEFGYFGTSSDEETPSWHGAWEAQPALPSLVRLHISFTDGTEAPDLVAAVRTAAGCGAMTSTARHPLSLRLEHAFRPLWQWWSQEVAAMMPAALKRWLAGQQGRLIVTIERDHATVLRDLGGQRHRLGSFDLANALPSEVGEILTSPADAPVLELPARTALRRVLALPAAAESNLTEVVSFELERHTPFRRADAYHGHRALGRDPSRQRILIELTVVPRAIIDDALSRLRGLGIDIAAVRISAEAPAGEASPNLLPGRPALRTPRLPQLAISIFVLTAAALAMAAITIPIVRVHREAARLGAALQSAKQQAAESVRLRKDIDAASADRGFLTARRRETVPFSRLLDTVTRLLPDDTWLTELSITGTDLEIAGLSASASRIIAILDGAPGFSDAAFRSPVTQDQLHQELFNIGAHVGPAVSK